MEDLRVANGQSLEIPRVDDANHIFSLLPFFEDVFKTEDTYMYVSTVFQELQDTQDTT